MKIKPVQLALKLVGKLFPPARPYIKINGKIYKYSKKSLPKDIEKRKKLADAIRKSSGIVSIIVLVVMIAGCQTVKDLRNDGVKVSHWQAVKLDYYDMKIWSESNDVTVMDYEIDTAKGK